MFIPVNGKKTVRCCLGQHLNSEFKYMLKDKNACKYFSGLGPNKHGKGSYSSLCVNKPLVVLSRMIHLPVFLRGNPSDHLLDWCWQCQRWGRGCTLNQSQQSLWTKSAWEYLYLKYLLALLFTNLKLIRVISLVEMSAVRWEWGERLVFQKTSFLNVILGVCLGMISE